MVPVLSIPGRGRAKPDRRRGWETAKLEWTLVSLAYNFKRLHRLGAGLKLAGH